MDLKEFTFRLVILFFPGLLAFKIFDRLTVHRKSEPFFFVIDSFIFGIVAYFFTWTLSLGLFPEINTKLQNLHARWSIIPTLDLPVKMAFWEELKDSNKSLELGEIAWTCAIAILLALIAAWSSNRKLHYRLARALRISKKSGELDVWGYVMNSKDPQTIFITVRDAEADLMYDGWIHSFSEDVTTTELFLGDVAVYRNTTGEFLYQIGAMYFKIDPKKVILEFRGIPVTEKHKVSRDHSHETESESAPQSESARELYQRGITEERWRESHTDKSTTPTSTSAASGKAGSTAVKSSEGVKLLPGRPSHPNPDQNDKAKL